MVTCSVKEKRKLLRDSVLQNISFFSSHVVMNEDKSVNEEVVRVSVIMFSCGSLLVSCL